MAPNAVTGGMPIAVRTCDGSMAPEVQAEPEATATPSISSERMIDSPSIPGKDRLTVWGSLFLREPFSLASDIRLALDQDIEL